MAKRKKAKRINYELVDPFEDKGSLTPSEPYAILSRMLVHHPHLSEAKIVLAWRKAWGEDRDGRLTLGACKRASDLDRQLKPYDFVILLNKEAWAALTPAQKDALIDHEAMHAAVVMDGAEPKRDEGGRIVYRIRKHDVEEFRDVIVRHGCYKADLEAFVRTIVEQQHTPLFPDGGDEAVAGSISEAS